MIAKHPGECRPHAFQDARYGKGFRVMNPTRAAKDRNPNYRCTVCTVKSSKTTYQLSELIVKRK